MKICVLLIFNILPWISRVGDWALRWTEGNTALQVVFVMLLFPLIMNGLQYYIIDSFIKNRIDPEDEASYLDAAGDDARDGNQRRSYQALDESDAMSIGSDGVEEALVKGMEGAHEAIEVPGDDPESKKATTRSGSERFGEYEPTRDGEPNPGSGATNNGSSSSQR